MLRNRLPSSVTIVTFLTLLLGLSATSLLFVAVRSLEHDALTLDFEQRAKVRLLIVHEGLQDAVDSVEMVNQLFATVGSVSREQFHTFTAPLLKHYPFIRAFNFHRIIASADLPAYEADMRKQHPGFTINELKDGKPVRAGSRERYVVVDYLEPMQGNEAAFGLDVSPNAHLAEVMRQAADSGLAASTDLLQLAQGSGPRRGFEVLKPVYRFGASLADAESRRRAVIGDTAAVFGIDDLIGKMLREDELLSASDMDINVYAGDKIDERNLAFRKGSAPGSQHVDSVLPAWVFYNDLKNIADTFDVAGKPWHMVISARSVPIVAHPGGSLFVLVGGALFSLLAAAFIHNLVSRSQRIRRLVDARTAEARLANQLLTQDIAARVRAEKALQLRHRAIEASPNAVIITSAAGPDYPIEYVNPAFEQMTGYAADEVSGRSLRLLNGEDRDQPGIKEFKVATQEKRAGHAILRSYRKDGTMFWSDLYVSPVRNSSGEVTHFVVAQYDITAMKRYEAELEFQANQDTLTGLANRNLLRDRLNQALAFADRYNHPVWVIFVDLDRFKFINDTLGHKAGDVLLKTVAERLQLAVRETDTVARVGSDEFVLVLPERSDERLAMKVIQRIMDAIAQPFTIEGHDFFMTCSVGMAVYPSDGKDTETLIKHADIAMYRAKEIGRNNSQFYMPAMNERALERLRLEGDLRSAVEQNQFELYYQPQVDLRSGKIFGMEALIRWQHPQFGMVAPIRFIGLAEDTGLIVPIGAWVIRTACAQNKAWQLAGHHDLRVSVNLSARQFAQQDLVESIAAVLQETGLAPHYLEIELTESLVMTDVEAAIRILRDLTTLGVQISIDDFGTGYSSLSYLKRLPIDILKIDQSFVRDITVDPDDAAIVASIVSLAHSLRLHVIAEGVETAEQLAYLQQHDCDAMQGYYFSRPIPAEEFGQLLQQGKCLADMTD